MYLTKIPKLLHFVFPKAIFRVNKKKVIYLTFDDGPTVGVTDIILSILEKYNAKATFFCLGKNAEKHPQIIYDIMQKGHLIGNHGYEHINGWKAYNAVYLDNMLKGKAILKTNFFRPPYGKIKILQFFKIRQTEKVVFWNLMPGDFDDHISEEQCYNNIKSQIKEGDIIVLHDTEKAKEKLLYVLPKLLEDIKKRGWEAAIFKQ